MGFFSKLNPLRQIRAVAGVAKKSPAAKALGAGGKPAGPKAAVKAPVKAPVRVGPKPTLGEHVRRQAAVRAGRVPPVGRGGGPMDRLK